MKETIQLVQDNEHVINEKAFRKENVEKTFYQIFVV